MSGTFFSALPNPKQNGTSIVGRHTWYSYYAGYSPTFVQKVLEDANLDPTAVVCDPWNGSGITIQIAHDVGYSTDGFDLNPVMVVVARSRLVMLSQNSALRRNLKGILRHARSYGTKEVSQSDPLNLWLKPCATLAVQFCTASIR